MDKFDTETDMDIGRGEESSGLDRGIILKSILRNRLWSGCRLVGYHEYYDEPTDSIYGREYFGHWESASAEDAECMELRINT